MKKESVLSSDQLRLAERILNRKLVLNKAISSPFRQDDHPSFSVYYGRDGRFRWKDFADEGGDIFSLATKAWGVDFKTALDRLFGMVNGDLGVPISPLLKSRQALRQVRISNTTITVQQREWDIRDSLYWNHKYGLDSDFLKQHDVFPLQEAHVRSSGKNDVTIRCYPYPSKNVMYGYLINGHWKIYRPLSPDRKYRYGPSNTTSMDVFGLKKLTQESIKKPVIITAGQKDALCASKYLGCHAISFNSESILPDPSLVGKLLQYGSSLHLLYDNDDAGKKATAKIIHEYPFIIPAQVDWPEQTKDIADLVEHGHWRLIEQLKHKLSS